MAAAGGRETVAQMLAYPARESGMLFGVFGILELDRVGQEVFWLYLSEVLCFTIGFVGLGVFVERLRGDDA